MSRIEFIDLKRQYASFQAQMDEAILAAVRRGDYILGHDTREFEKEFAAFSEAPHCVGVADGTDALNLALRACGIGPGDEVILPANTFIATILAVTAAGATPVLVDCEPDYLTIDVTEVEKALTPRTKALMPVHLYGQPADMDPLLEIAKDRGLRIVEDAAQAHGARYKGRRCGTMGDAAGFSFYPGKNLGAYGDGGAVVTSRSDVAEAVGLLRNYGQRVKYYHDMKGYNSRLDTVQAAILRVKLGSLDAGNEARRRAAQRYSELLAETPVGLPKTAPYSEHVWHLFVIQCPDRSAIQQSLTDADIQHGIHYPVPIHLQKAYADLGLPEGTFPVAEAAAGRILSLPMFPEITDHEIERVAAAVKRAC